MTELVADAHRDAVFYIYRSLGAHFFNAAMNVMPECVPETCGDAWWGFANVVKEALLQQENDVAEFDPDGFGPDWTDILGRLRDSAEFRKAVDWFDTQRTLKALADDKAIRSFRERIVAEAEEVARDYILANKHRESTADPVTIIEVFENTGVSVGRISRLVPWQELMAERKQRKPKKPRVFRLTEQVVCDDEPPDAVTDDQHDEDETLHGLTEAERARMLRELEEEQKKDYEPHPLDKSARRPPITRPSL
jgi:hypothetical protein